MAPLWLIGKAVRSVAGTLLGGGWVSALLHPATLLTIGVVFLTGWSYQKGKQHERRAQAQAIVALNKDVASWRKAYQEADDAAEGRLNLALDNWRKTTGSAAVVSTSCRLAPKVATTIADIAGD